MRLIEYEAKALLKEAGFTIPAGQLVASSPMAAEAAFPEKKGAVLKVQVPTGGRMRAGGIRLVDTAAEALSVATGLLWTKFRGYRPTHLLVEEKLPIEREIFLSFTYDAACKRPLLLASAGGGIEIEAETNLISRHFSARQPPPAYFGREVAANIGIRGWDAAGPGHHYHRIGPSLFTMGRTAAGGQSVNSDSCR